MDGTIVDNMKWHAQAWVELFADEGVEISAQAIFDLAGKKTDEIIRTFLGSEVPHEECVVLARQKEFLYRHLYRPHRKPVDGLVELLDQSRRAGLKLGVATSAEQKNIQFTLDGLDLRRHFDRVVGAEEIKRGKPEPDAFLRTAELLGVDPAACVVFEDARMGIEAGRRAGMRVVGVATDLSIGELTALPGVVQAIQRFSDFDLRPYLQEQP